MKNFKVDGLLKTLSDKLYTPQNRSPNNNSLYRNIFILFLYIFNYREREEEITIKF